MVVPTLLTSHEQTERAVRDLEIRFLGNRDNNLHLHCSPIRPMLADLAKPMDGLWDSGMVTVD